MPRRPPETCTKSNGLISASTSTSTTLPRNLSAVNRTNGSARVTSAGISLDTDDPEFIREKQRPAAIKEDLWEMGRRKRVNEVLHAKDFCSELEEVIRPNHPPPLATTKSFPDGLDLFQQRFSALSFPRALPSAPGKMPAINLLRALNPEVIPIADLPDNRYSNEEQIARDKLATLYRLIDLFQWSQGIYNHITLRLPGPENEPPEILINPFGLLYQEITASSLVKLSLDGRVLDPGSTRLGVNQAGYVLHSAIHEARPDVQCVLHLHTAVVSAVSSMKCGLLPICQEAMIIGPVAYHDYQGIVSEEEEKESIVRDLGEKNVILLKNHGFVACGQSVPDALHLAFHTIIACETQIRAARAGFENLVIPSEESVLRGYKTARKGGGGVNRITAANGNGLANSQSSWDIGELEWEAYMRIMDSVGYQTGHIYKEPQLRHPFRTSTGVLGHRSMYNLSSVATPPSVTPSTGAVIEESASALAEHKNALLRRAQERVRWLTSPNSYQKVQLFETGSADKPRVITKWVEQTSASHNGTPVKIHSPHQFSPFSASANPREFKQRQQRLKDQRLSGAISPGPQSQVLVGPILIPSDDLAGREHDAMGYDPRHYPLIIGTASKGIIDRQFQHNAQVYQQMYAPNPFVMETDDGLKKYFREVEERRSKSIPALSEYQLNGNGNSHRSPPPLRSPADADSTVLMQAVRFSNGTKPYNGNGGMSASRDEQRPVMGIDRSFSSDEVVCGNNRRFKEQSSELTSDTDVEASRSKKKKRRGFFSFGRKQKAQAKDVK